MLQLLSDAKLEFNRITCDSYTVKLWLHDEIFRRLIHSDECKFFDLNDKNTLLTVATKVGVTVWNLRNYTQVFDKNIGSTEDVRFNADSTKIIASTTEGKVYELRLE